MNNKPVLQAGAIAATVIALFKAFIILARVMNWFNLTDEQFSAWVSFLEILIPALVTGVMTWWLTRKTTALSRPRDEDGVPLVRVDTKGPTKSEERSIDRAIFGKE